MILTNAVSGAENGDMVEPLDLSISTLIHDLNNLLTTVICHGTLALAKVDDGNVARPHIEKTLQAARYAAALSRQLNLVAKGPNGIADTTDLNSLIQEVVDLLTPVFLDRVNVDLELGSHLPTLHIPKIQVQQILMNLLINAAEAIQDERGRITIETREEIFNLITVPSVYSTHFAPKPGHYVVLQVTDTGVGMSEHALAGLLVPYFTTKPRGRGLGLMSVVKILNDWGGGLLVKSQPRHGSTFSVYLPAFRTAANAIG